MQTPWTPIFDYNRERLIGSQAIYEQILKLALTYKYGRSGLGVVPVDDRALTEAIFDLNSHDTINLSSRKRITGQQLKELFVTTIFLRFVEGHLREGSPIYLALPKTTSSVDTAILVGTLDSETSHLDDYTARLSKLLVSFELQVKEFTEYQGQDAGELITPNPIDVAELIRRVKSYSEIVLVYGRTFATITSNDLVGFFGSNPHVYLITAFGVPLELSPDANTGETRIVRPKANKHNYLIAVSPETVVTLTFDIPNFLVPRQPSQYVA